MFTSRDGKVAVRVFASTPRRSAIEILQVIDFLSAPLPPGNLVGLLAYEIRASHCDSQPAGDVPGRGQPGDPLQRHRGDGPGREPLRDRAAGHADGTWYAVEKRANDPANNVDTATISETGFYMVWEER